MRLALLIALVLGAASLSVAAVDGGGPKGAAGPAARAVHRSAKPFRAPVRPPQFVVVGFDGAGGWRMWKYWLGVGRAAHAHFTFFLSGAYLVDWAHRMRYRPPLHPAGTSSIGFSEETGDLTVANTLRGVVAGYRAGDEIGTHYVGHFCSPDPYGVGAWTAADWKAELAQFDALLFRSGTYIPFGRAEIVGSRTPCLEGNLRALYPVLGAEGFRYDGSRQALLGTWPTRVDGIWSVPLLEIPFVGHTFRVVSMDYNLFANQVDESPARVQSETYRSLWSAFRASYLGRRAPLTIGQHFETWKSWAYDRALARFLIRACGMPEVRCVGYGTLVSFLDRIPPSRLRRYEAGRFPRLPPARTALTPR